MSFLQHIAGLQHGIGFDHSALGGDADLLLFALGKGTAHHGVAADAGILAQNGMADDGAGLHHHTGHDDGILDLSAVADGTANGDDGVLHAAVDLTAFRMVAKLGVPYILMSTHGEMGDIMINLAREVQMLRDLGVKDIILDPGFGFGKTLDQNYILLQRMDELKAFGLPVLVGASRKSMIFRLLDSTPAEALNGTTVVNTHGTLCIA